jgi:hypothetical protein
VKNKQTGGGGDDDGDDEYRIRNSSVKDVIDCGLDARIRCLARARFFLFATSYKYESSKAFLPSTKAAEA